MMPCTKCRWWSWIVAVLLGTVAAESVADAQLRQPRRRSGVSRPKIVNGPTRKPAPAERTTISLTIITRDNAAALRAAAWKSTLQKLGVSFRIRSAVSTDKLDVRETKYGTFRKVTVVGRLDRRGRLVFKNRTFSRSDAPKLAEWIRELKTYGAQGAPQGKPLWGLSKAQFGKIYRALSEPAKALVHGKELRTALKLLNLPEDYPVRFSVAAKRALRGETVTIRHHVKGHAKGTALSLLLKNAGLGFRPLRTPQGTIELVIDPLSVAKHVWPVGWEPKESRLKTAPKYFTPGPVHLDKVKLVDVFHTVAVQTGVPVHLDYRTIEKHDIELQELTVSYPPRKVSSSVLLRDLCALHKLSRELRIDERGQPFVWATVFVPKPISR